MTIEQYQVGWGLSGSAWTHALYGFLSLLHCFCVCIFFQTAPVYDIEAQGDILAEIEREEEEEL